MSWVNIKNTKTFVIGDLAKHKVSHCALIILCNMRMTAFYLRQKTTSNIHNSHIAFFSTEMKPKCNLLQRIK